MNKLYWDEETGRVRNSPTRHGWHTELYRVSEVRERIAAVLREHWLTGVECHHERKTDTATCFCSVWRSTEQPNPAQAVERWIEHALAHLDAPQDSKQ